MSWQWNSFRFAVSCSERRRGGGTDITGKVEIIFNLSPLYYSNMPVLPQEMRWVPWLLSTERCIAQDPFPQRSASQSTGHLSQPTTASMLAQGKHSVQATSALQHVLVTVQLCQVSSSAKGLCPSRLSVCLLSQQNLPLQGLAGERRVTLIAQH